MRSAPSLLNCSPPPPSTAPAPLNVGIPFNEDEALGRAVHVLLALVGPADDEIEPDEAHDPHNHYADYNDDELLQCGIWR